MYIPPFERVGRRKPSVMRTPGVGVVGDEGRRRHSFGHGNVDFIFFVFPVSPLSMATVPLLDLSPKDVMQSVV